MPLIIGIESRFLEANLIWNKPFDWLGDIKATEIDKIEFLSFSWIIFRKKRVQYTSEYFYRPWGNTRH